VRGYYDGRGNTVGPTPIKVLRRVFAYERIVVAVDGFRSTVTHNVCGTVLVPRPTEREKYCIHCALTRC
jgi:hypothetical protein